MVERWLVIFSLCWMSAESVLWAQASEQSSHLTEAKSGYEIGLTPRFRYLSFKNSAQTGNDVFLMLWAPRIQVAAEVYPNAYVILFYDWMGRRTDESNFYGNDYNGTKFGMQLSYKFMNAYIEQYLIQVRSKRRYLRLYPELMVATGWSNLSSTQYFEDLMAGAGQYGIYEFSVGLNIVISKLLNLQVTRAVGLEPHERHRPHKHYSLFKLIYKV